MKYIQFDELPSGETVGLCALEVHKIPHISLWGKAEPDEEFLVQHQAYFAGILGEMHQVYKESYAQSGIEPLLSIDLLWICESVSGQVNRGRIRLFLIFRVIGDERKYVEDSLDYFCQSTQRALMNRKYEVAAVQTQELAQAVKVTDDARVLAIAKEERLVNIQNQIMPQCFSYDLLAGNGDISGIVHVLTEYPGCALSFQLMPTRFEVREESALKNTAQVLDTLGRGIVEQGVGTMSFSLAEKRAQAYRHYTENENAPLYLFNLLVWGSKRAVSMVSARIMSYWNNVSPAGLRTVGLTKDELGKDANLLPMPWAINELLLDTDRIAFLQANAPQVAGFHRLPFIITGNEATTLFTLPVGSNAIAAGFNVNESKMDSRSYSPGIIDSGDIEVGKLKSSNLQHSIGLSLSDMTKHMLVVGTPGSGKTTFSVSLLDRLWKQYNIPFLVIEPAKNEYRALIQSISDLQVFTPGKNHISPFVFNPFVPPKNVRLEAYKSTLKTAFAAAVSMSTPLDKIFEESVNNCYSDFRWLDSYTIDDRGGIFNIADFIKCFQETFDEIGYTGDAKNIGRAGIVRLNGLANLFDNYYSIPIEGMLKKPTVIELAAVENSDQKALIISLLLLNILAYVNSNYIGEGKLRNVILLEEAHVLLDADANSGQGEANPSAVAQGLVKRMLAEIRSYGVGIVIADQSPRKVTADVVALTDIKLAFRLVEASDKQILSDSTNMSEVQMQRLSKLKPGEAFLFFGKLDEPEEVKTPDYRLENNISVSLSDDGIRALTTYWNDQPELLRPYPQCQFVPYCSSACDYKRRILAREVARRIFRQNFKPDSFDYALVNTAFRNISLRIQAELNGEEFSRELLSCVRVHLWRRIKYGTQIAINDEALRASCSQL